MNQDIRRDLRRDLAQMNQDICRDVCRDLYQMRQDMARGTELLRQETESRMVGHIDEAAKQRFVQLDARMRRHFDAATDRIDGVVERLRKTDAKVSGLQSRCDAG